MRVLHRSDAHRAQHLAALHAALPLIPRAQHSMRQRRRQARVCSQLLQRNLLQKGVVGVLLRVGDQWGGVRCIEAKAGNTRQRFFDVEHERQNSLL